MRATAMRNFTFLISTSLVLTVSVAHLAIAQNFNVQQPVVQRFEVSTTVITPDRGTAFLGGVSGARSSSNQYGPFHLGSDFGYERHHSSTAVSVQIHDFELMDQLLLMEGQRRLRSLQPESVTDRRVRHVLRQSASRSTNAATQPSQTLSERENALSVIRRFR